MAEALGLSVGATNMSGVVLRRSAVTRQSVITLYRHRPPEIGVPSENPGLTEPGLVITGFVDRVGDPVGIVAADGSVHRGEALVADALRALAATVAPGQQLPATVTYPAHWRPQAVEALRGELTGEQLVSDAAAALSSLQSDPGLPSRGVIALCDFGGTGTSITLADAANGYRPIGPTVRHVDFSGELIDQALLKRVVADLSGAGSVDVTGTSAIGSLNRLRAQCRAAKERLSAVTVTSLSAELPGFTGDIRLTRAELDNEVR
ncbi:MAG: Hsp70 family protein, partial [Mycobacteriaceae bacterium]|nr:Hsp70 family protein [Mycobacteriaceae bacterium]